MVGIPLNSFVKELNLVPTNNYEKICHLWTKDRILKEKFESYRGRNEKPAHLSDKEWKLISPEARFQIISKISLSSWHWGFISSTWENIVEAYNSIRQFDFGEGFEVSLDWTTGYNDYGYSYLSETYIDGEMAFLIHNKGQHVLTIGFSISGKRVLVQQVQLKNKKGNRWLYKLHQHPIDYVLNCFRKAFPGFEVYLVNGEDLSARIVNSYKDNKPKQENIVRISKWYSAKLDHHVRKGWMRCNKLRFNKVHGTVS